MTVEEIVVSRGPVKFYESKESEMIYLFFKNENKAMVDPKYDKQIKLGSTIEFAHEAIKGWHNSDDIIGVVGHRPYEMIIGYVTRAKFNKNGEPYYWSFNPTMIGDARHIKKVYIPQHLVQSFFGFDEPNEKAKKELTEIWDTWYNAPEYTMPNFHKVIMDGARNGETLFVEKIISCEEVIEGKKLEIDVRQVGFGMGKISFIHDGYSYVDIPVPFECSPVLNKAGLNQGKIRINGVFLLGGKLEKTVDSWLVHFIRKPFKNIEIDTDSDLLNAIKGFIDIEKFNAAWKYVQDDLKVRYYASIQDVQKVFRDHGLDMDEKDIVEVAFQDEYDSQYFQLLDQYRKDNNGQLYIAEEGFAFQIKGALIFERPVKGAATYIFRAIDKVEVLFNLFMEAKNAGRLGQFYRDYDDFGSKEESGYVDRVVHTTPESWYDRLLHKLSKV